MSMTQHVSISGLKYCDANENHKHPFLFTEGVLMNITLWIYNHVVLSNLPSLCLLGRSVW
jgi:hypothetical protein